MKQIIHFSYLSIITLSFIVDTQTVHAQQKRLSLQEAVTLAAENNPELKASQLEIDKSRQQKVISRSLLLPTIHATAAGNHYFQLPPFFGFGGVTPDGKISYGRFGGNDQLAAVVSATQPLYNPVAFPSLQRARLQEQESKVAWSGKQVSILSLVKQTYIQLLVLNERIKLQRESISRNQRVLKDARSLLVQGKGLRVDTLRAYTSVKNLEPELLKLTYAVETSKLQLKALIGIDSLREIALIDSLTVPDPETIPREEEVYRVANQNNTDLQLLVLQRQISEQQSRQAHAGRLPVVSAVALYQVQSQTSKFDYGTAYYPSSSFAGLQVSVPLFTGFSNQANVKQAGIAEQQSVFRLKNAREQLKATVHQAVANGHESRVRIQTTASVQETAKLSYTIIQYRYAKGIASRLDLTDAELALTTSQSNYLEAVYDYLSARIALLQIMGKVEESVIGKQ
jgi:outer membrane protein TolC